MIIDTGQFTALRVKVDEHDPQIADTSAKFDSLIDFMRMCLREAGIDRGSPPGRQGRRERHLHLVEGGRP